jgi:hypothetical protein
VPPDWYGGDLGEMEALVVKLLARRRLIRECIQAFGTSDRRPFPNWGATATAAADSWGIPAFGAIVN